MNKTTVSIALLFGAAMAWNAQAQSPDCDDVVWGDDLLERIPGAPNHCLEVVQRGDQYYARLEAEVVTQRGDGDTLVRFREANGGWSGVEHVYPPEGFTAMISGEEVPISELRSGQELTVMIRDEGHFTVPQMAQAPARSEPAPAPAPAPRRAPEPEPAPTMLPSTAGNANWLVVFGGLMLALAATMRVARNRG